MNQTDELELISNLIRILTDINNKKIKIPNHILKIIKDKKLSKILKITPTSVIDLTDLIEKLKKNKIKIGNKKKK